ncbi:MAG: DNA polymerase [Oscillospiraceae bacterium]
MKVLTIDIETRSDVDITKSGLYKYAESPDFDILLISVSTDGGDVITYDIASGDKLPKNIIEAFTDNRVVKRAFNVNFERVCLSVYIRRNYPDMLEDSVGNYLSPDYWQCDMVHARYLGMPSSLEQLGEILHIEQKKLDSGKSLIKYFCTPNKDGTFNKPSDVPDKWIEFKKYNKRDVEAELEIQKKLAPEPVPDAVWEEFYLDQKIINDRGILVDIEYVEKAIELSSDEKKNLLEKMKLLTGLSNPNSVVQLKTWLKENGIDTESLDKKTVEELISKVPDNIKEVLKLRQKISKSSVKKYEAMINSVCSDNRARGMFSFYGASRTGRFSGLLIQLQNLPQNHLSELVTPKELIRAGKYENLRKEYDDVTDVLSQLIRTSFIPQKDKKFIVADFSAIEARVIAWLANEKWRIQAFANGEDIYCASASKMFDVPVEKNGVNGHLRQKGKIAELACGYGGSIGAMKNMGGTELKLSDDELQKLVDDWRAASPNIVKLWNDVGNTAMYTIKNKCKVCDHGLEFSLEGSILFITLPSGRRLSYCKPEISTNRFGGECIVYMGVDSNKNWSVIETYGAKLVENIVQGIARDILLYAMKNLSKYDIVAHVHDEVIIEDDKDTAVSDICEIMSKTPDWAKGLLLRADGYECDFYMKA